MAKKAIGKKTAPQEMIQLHCRTEFSFREAYGSVEKVLACTKGPLAITDRHGTWGHVVFEKACKKAGRKPILGVELAVVENARLREKQGTNFMSFLARNAAGLREIYELVTLATTKELFYYYPRIDYSDLMDMTENVIILSGNFPVWGSLPRHPYLFVQLSPTSSPRALTVAREKKLPLLATSDNLYPRIPDRAIYQVIAGRNSQMRTAISHLLTKEEWMELWPNQGPEPFENQQWIADECDVGLPRASLVHFPDALPLRKLCERAAKARGINLKDPVYRDRLTRELDLIAEKKFEDYFYLVADIIAFAKQHMLVGPARGSSCGSLVCYLLSITEIDPIPYSLLFERFIDVTRKDLPDIDIDFPDDRRDMVFEYVRQKYGADCVARLGTIMRYKAKSCLSVIAKEMSIPAWEIADLKNSIIERSTGDSRAAFCIMDTFEQLEIGKSTLAKYPALRIAEQMENHASGKGQHAAGIVVTPEPINHFCSVDSFTGSVMIDKHDAEDLNLLKIDALGLRTLSVLQDCLDHVGWSREKLLRYPVDDGDAFQVLNDQKYAGIFQFEGYALQNLCKQLTIETFEDIASLTALARPGPLSSGGANEYIRRRTGQAEVSHLHPLIAHTTAVSYGIVIYQEQVMQIAREMGLLSWEDVSTLRKAMSKSLGKEYFDAYYERFRLGAVKQKVDEEDARRVWDNICTFGAWGFNRSHAVAYGMVSYWTLVMKSKYPLEYAAACLRNSRDDEQCIRLLRELVREGYNYKAYDAQLSEKNWTVQKGVLIGGLLNIKGVGAKTADDILQRRKDGKALTAGVQSKLANATTPFDTVFECADRFGHIRKNPEQHNIQTRMMDIGQITADDDGEVVVIGKLKEKNLRDLNELTNLQKRGGRRMQGQTLFLNFTLEDDSGTIFCTIDRHNYLRWAKPLIERHKIGEWFLWHGNMRAGFRKLYIDKWRPLEEPAEQSLK